MAARSIVDEGSITSPQGFKATGIHSGLKPVRARDLALIYSTQPSTAAAMFTTSAIKGAPVLFNQAILARNRDRIRAVLINSGVANVGTGREGLDAAAECAHITAEELEIASDSVLIMSTGLIGVPLPMDRLRPGIQRAVSELDTGGGRRAALAILTTDQQPKQAAITIQQRDGRLLTIAGMAKGGNRVHPNLATLLCVLTTDGTLPAPLLARSLRQAVERSFHCISIDGDMSPNDSILILANGAAGLPPIKAASSWEYGSWQEALDELSQTLAHMVVQDCVSTQALIKIEVSGARTNAEARLAALALCRSPGVRQAWKQGLLDWTAVVAALGAGEIDVAAERLSLQYNDQQIASQGQVQAGRTTTPFSWDKQPETVLRLALNLGDGQAVIWTRV